MRRSIELNEAAEANLREMAARSGRDQGEVLNELVSMLLHNMAHPSSLGMNPGGWVHPAELQGVKRTPGVMGGEACIRDTRIAVWMLVEYKKQGLPDGEILKLFPALNASDLVLAWDYFASHPEEVQRAIKENEDAA